MRAAKSSRKVRLDALQYRYTATCCGDEFSWPGRVPTSRYVCRRCRQDMTLTEERVMSRADAELIVRNEGRFNGEPCHCGALNGHTVRFDEELSAYFLHCGQCKEELRELERKEVKTHEADKETT